MHINITAIRSTLVLYIIFAYMLLGYGFQLVRIPPTSGAGVPSGEILILLFAIGLVRDIHHFPSFVRVAPIFLLLLFWGQGLGQTVVGISTHGMWAMRDATFVLESFFIWIGYVVASRAGFIDRFYDWMSTFLKVAVIYGLGYPFREVLQGASPKITSANGQEIPIFFNFTMTPTLVLVAAMKRVLQTKSLDIPALAITGIMIIYVAGFWQQRTMYLQIIALMMMLAWLKKEAFGRMAFVMLIGFLAMILALGAGVELTGRLGQKINLDFFLAHFQAIWGVSTEVTKSAADGVDWRLELWKSIWYDLNETTWKLLTGLGFGQPLIDFHGPGGEVVRIPHNTLITILGRMGLIGVITFIIIHILLMKTWIKTYVRSKQMGNDRWVLLLLLFLSFFICVGVYAIGEGSVELPYIAIPYYFFWGIVLRMRYETRYGGRAPKIMKQQ